jgi:non-specific serine/threonine protein kinase
MDTVYEYDPATDAWTQLPDMPWPPLQDFGIAFIDGYVYTAGGSNWEPALKTVRAYDPFTDEWSGKTEMPLALAWPHAELVNGKMYVFDGNNTLEYTPQNDIL